MFARDETGTSVQWLQGLANLDMPEEVIEDNEDRKVITRYTPLGVVGAIVPWNFPIQLACGKMAPALLTGNVIIVKPSYVSCLSYCVCASWLTGDVVKSIHAILRPQARRTSSAILPARRCASA